MVERTGTYRLLISGGGTGGHIFPAVSIAQEFKNRYQNANILFVGAKGKMEMEKVPQAGFPIIGLWISGIQRKFSPKNLLFPFKLFWSILRSLFIVISFKPHAVVGVGGYSSGPLLLAAAILRKPIIVQEQNAYAGLTNKWLARFAKKVCVAYEGMEDYFPAHKLVYTGNPVRRELLDAMDQGEEAKRKAKAFFGFSPDKKTILVIGGSLGAKTINKSIEKNFELFKQTNIQVLWQCGKIYFPALKDRIGNQLGGKIQLREFIKEMDKAYTAADLVISRAGALSVSEICLLGKASILVPSPNVAEDHQNKNALNLKERKATKIVSDKDSIDHLVPQAITLVTDEQKCKELAHHASKLGKPNAAREIVEQLEKIILPKDQEQLGMAGSNDIAAANS